MKSVPFRSPQVKLHVVLALNIGSSGTSCDSVGRFSHLVDAVAASKSEVLAEATSRSTVVSPALAPVLAMVAVTAHPSGAIEVMST